MEGRAGPAALEPFAELFLLYAAGRDSEEGVVSECVCWFGRGWCGAATAGPAAPRAVPPRHSRVHASPPRSTPNSLQPQAEVGQCLKQCREEGLDREGVLYRLATTVEGVYVPQFYDSPAG